MTEFLGIPVSDLSAPALLGLFVLAILAGWLVPRRTLKDVQEERDKWRAAYETQVTITQAQSDQLTNLSEGARLSQRIAEATAQVAAASGFSVIAAEDRERESNVGGEHHEN